MPPYIPSFSSAEMFQLIAEGGQTFLVPKEILASQSEPFRKHTTSRPWIPHSPHERSIDLQKWDPETVNQLVCFLYRNVYQGPPAAETLAAVLLAHVRVYALAQYTEVEALSNAVFKSLQNVLSSRDPSDVTYRRAVMELSRYVYSPSKFRMYLGHLRELVSRFTARKFEKLYIYEEMAELIVEDNSQEFRTDLIMWVSERFNDMGRLEGQLGLEKKRSSDLQAALVAAEKRASTLKEKVRSLERKLVDEQRRKQAGVIQKPS